MSGISEPWLEQLAGKGPVLVLAPHGGRREREAAAGDRVNDLHTAEIARELAVRLGAAALINHGLDRNETDLNRISELVDRGSGFLDPLLAMVEETVEGHGRALVLLIHGWNMALAGCDIGVGLRSDNGHNRGRYPTVGHDCLDTTVAVLQNNLAGQGFAATLGQRYPAAAANNATQLFSGRHLEHTNRAVSRLARLGAEGRVDAIQLELGIPLRWPGPRRQCFIDAATEAAASYPVSSTPLARAPVTDGATKTGGSSETEAGGLAEKGHSLQLLLDGGHTALLFGVEVTGRASMATRLCLLRTDGSMSLFVAEGPWNGDSGSYKIAGLAVEASPGGGLAVEFEGPMISYQSHDAFLDLERGLASAGLEEVRISLRCDSAPEGFSRVIGSISRDGHPVSRVRARAALGRGGGRMGAGRGPGTVLRVTEGSLGPRRIELAGPMPGGDGELRDSEGRLWRLHPIAVVPLVRAVQGQSLRVSFGVVAVKGDGAEGLALFESVSGDG